MATNPLNFVKDRLVAGRKLEEAFYEAALREFHSGTIRPGLMAKAMAECDGNELKARALYVGLLVTALRDDYYLEQRKKEELAKAFSNTLAQLEKEDREKEKDEKRPVSREEAESWSDMMLGAILLAVAGLTYLLVRFGII